MISKSKTIKSKNIKTKNIKFNKFNKHNKLNKNKTKKIIKIIKNKKGGSLTTDVNETKGSIDSLNKQYSGDDYHDTGMFDFMKIKTQGNYLKPGVEMPPPPAGCSIS